MKKTRISKDFWRGKFFNGIVFLILLFYSGWISAQDSLSLITDSIVITANRETLRSYENANPLTQLTLQNAIMSRQGNTGFTGLRSQGLVSRQIPINWNGINLQSPHNGTLDINLLPPWFNFRMINEADSPLKLNLTIPSRKSVDLNYQFIGNGKFTSMYELKFGNVSHQLGVNVNGGKNRYQYRHGETSKTLDHASFFNTDLMYNIFWYSVKNRFEGNFWYQNYDRNIIPPKGTVSNNEHQKDENFRANFSFSQSISANSELQFQLFGFKEQIIFTTNSLYSNGVVFTYGILTNWKLNSGFKLRMNAKKIQSDASFYTQRPSYTDVDASVSKSFRIDWHTIKLSGSIRRFDGAILPINYGFCYIMELSSFKIMLNSSSNHVIPTLNDRYWPIGGNLDLLTERNYLNSAKITWPEAKSYSTQMLFFYNLFSQQIVWSPNPTLTYWTPDNVGKSRAIGLNLEGRFNIRITQNLTFNLNLSTTYQKTKILKDKRIYLIGKELIYQPNFYLTFSPSFKWKKLKLNVDYLFKSRQYYLFDNSNSISASHLVDVSIRYQILASTYTYFKINNVFNADYEEIKSYPLPLNFVELGITKNL
ncbi:MAG TPA: outer membrane beta-barrel protein [Saprospiraceae bacterium]|nr:outer membrane beta-barrel protein [Saprospiraceae bacterium]